LAPKPNPCYLAFALPKQKKVIRDQWPRVYWTPKRGVLRLCVDSRKTGFPAGKREFWDTEAEALASAQQIARIKENEGALSFLELTPAERRDAAEALSLLDGAGTLLDAARSFMRERDRQSSRAQVPSVSEAIKLYLSTKEAEEARSELSRLTLYDIKSKLRIVAAEFGHLSSLSEIDEAAVETFLRKRSLAPRSKQALRTKLSQLLNYARRQKWIVTNPTENVKVRIRTKDVEILSVEEVDRLLRVVSKEPAVAPFILVQTFGGLRPYEALRLRWEKIHFETAQLEVAGTTSKVRETRFVTMNPTLIEWLLPYRQKSGPIKGPRFERVLVKLKRAAGFCNQSGAITWPKDVLRHCYGSYWLAVHKDRAHLAEQMGTSLNMIKRHYRRAIPESVAQEFWKLSPSPAKPGKIILMDAAAG
jgi:integrase